jgi:hypothetical protein
MVVIACIVGVACSFVIRELLAFLWRGGKWCRDELPPDED